MGAHYQYLVKICVVHTKADLRRPFETDDKVDSHSLKKLYFFQSDVRLAARAAKIGNQRLLLIHFHTFRHWKATMLYHQTKAPLRVQRFLGHTTFQHTMVYIHLEEALFQDTNDDYMCKTATTAEEEKALIEVGFEYVNEIQGIHLYRKRK